MADKPAVLPSHPSPPEACTIFSMSCAEQGPEVNTGLQGSMPQQDKGRPAPPRSQRLLLLMQPIGLSFGRRAVCGRFGGGYICVAAPNQA